MRPRILVINPNSNESVTEALRSALAGYSAAADVECCTLADGPFGIETDEDRAAVVPMIVSRIEASPLFDAYVIACYCDPGLETCRERFDKPVFGIQESAVREACRGGRQFGVLALSDASITGHLAYIERLGLSASLAGELPLDITVDQSVNDPATPARIVEQGRRLVDELGAGAVVLGCAGMAAHKKPAAEALRVPVIEPVEAAVAAALAALHAAG
ncbi:MAG: aspartate/glutamate racemase family protein [Gammaproteobacteria bacterium]|nr:aspartate/glutamate racemase family protein [Gammaproteobacteria bacterium]